MQSFVTFQHHYFAQMSLLDDMADTKLPKEGMSHSTKLSRFHEQGKRLQSIDKRVWIRNQGDHMRPEGFPKEGRRRRRSELLLHSGLSYLYNNVIFVILSLLSFFLPYLFVGHDNWHCYVFPEFLQVTRPSFKSHWIPINGTLKIHWLELESSDSNQWILSISLIGIGRVGFQSMDFKYTIDWNPTS